MSDGAPTADVIEVGPVVSLADFEAEVTRECMLPWTSKLGGKMIHEFLGVKPVRRWMLKHVVLANTLFLVVGAPGSGKSFLWLDLAMTMAMAVVDDRQPTEWFGRKIKPCGVVYIAAEGQDDFVIRVFAWLASKGLALDTQFPFLLIPTPINMRESDADTNKLIDDIKGFNAVCQERFKCGVEMVVVDTFNRALAGGDDSKPEHVGAFIKHASKIRAETRVTVIPVCHTAKVAFGRGPLRTDPRGHGSITGDNDGEMFVLGAMDGSPNSWRVTRNKAGPAGDRHEFRLRPFEVDRDEDNEAVTSCIIAPGASERALEGLEQRDAAEASKTGKPTMTADGRAILPPNLSMTMSALHGLVEERGEYPPPAIRAPVGRKAVLMKDWLDEIVQRAPGDDKSNKDFRERCRKARDRAAMSLRMRGILDMDGDWVWRTTRRVAGIDRPETDEPVTRMIDGEPITSASGIEF